MAKFPVLPAFDPTPHNAPPPPFDDTILLALANAPADGSSGRVGEKNAQAIVNALWNAGYVIGPK